MIWKLSKQNVAVEQYRVCLYFSIWLHAIQSTCFEQMLVCVCVTENVYIAQTCYSEHLLPIWDKKRLMAFNQLLESTSQIASKFRDRNVFTEIYIYICTCFFFYQKPRLNYLSASRENYSMICLVFFVCQKRLALGDKVNLLLYCWTISADCLMIVRAVCLAVPSCFNDHKERERNV